MQYSAHNLMCQNTAFSDLNYNLFQDYTEDIDTLVDIDIYKIQWAVRIL